MVKEALTFTRSRLVWPEGAKILEMRCVEGDTLLQIKNRAHVFQSWRTQEFVFAVRVPTLAEEQGRGAKPSVIRTSR